MADPEYEAWITNVRQATDIVEVISRTVALRRGGKHYWGLCPFHTEKTPSFSVDAEQQLFYCFGCHSGGTVFTFLMRREGAEFIDVVRHLGEETGIAEPKRGSSRQSAHDSLYSVLGWCQEYFQRGRERVEPFLARRELPWSVAERFQLGYAPRDWRGLVTFLRERGVSEREMVAAGVAVADKPAEAHDRWRHRLMFPIWDARGRICAFGGRALDSGQEPKYLNSPETPIFHKGQVLYGLHLARPRWQAGAVPVLVEGYFDVVACHTAGLDQTVASLGTALSSGQARWLARFGSEVTLAYDLDDAGQQATKRAFVILSEVGLKVNWARWNEAWKDPDEVRKQGGEETLRAVVDANTPYLAAVAETLHGTTPREKAYAVQTVRPLLMAVSDPVERHGYLEIIARKLRVDLSILAQSAEDSQGAKDTFGKNRHNMRRTGEKPSPTLPSVDVELLAALLRHPQAIPDVRAKVPEWPREGHLETTLDFILTRGTDNLADWIDGVESDGRRLLLEALEWQGPDGGQTAIDDFVERIKERGEQERLQTLQERARQGECAEELMREVRAAMERLGRQKARKEG